jgi:hypothetical protein
MFIPQFSIKVDPVDNIGSNLLVSKYLSDFLVGVVDEIGVGPKGLACTL